MEQDLQNKMRIILDVQLFEMISGYPISRIRRNHDRDRDRRRGSISDLSDFA